MIPSNPFCTRFVRPGAVAYRFAADQSGQLDSIVKRIKGVRHGLIIGPHGSGKSTLIHSLLPILRREYPNVVCCQLCDSKSPHPIDRLRQAQGQRRQLQHCLRQLNHQDLLIIDGIEQLTVVNRIRSEPLWQSIRTIGPGNLPSSIIWLSAVVRNIGPSPHSLGINRTVDSKLSSATGGTCS